jgi:glycosyltransferase involved in cell wall biosynthesis
MEQCIDSLLPGISDAEIIVVDDGSTDETARIADDYAARYPEAVRVIHQENSGHGGAINAGVRKAEGTYIKVVDSDDWVDVPAFLEVLETLKSFSGGGRPEDAAGKGAAPDVVITNYVYEKEGKRRKMAIRYTASLPVNRIFTWNEVGRFRKGKYILMHSLIYRAAVLRECGFELPEHSFYVDNLYAWVPLRRTQTLYYMNVDLYRYRTGRAGQSVQEEIMIARIDQQLAVNRAMITALNLEEIEEKRKRQYLFNYLEIVTLASSALLLCAGTPEHLRKKNELWQFIRLHNRRLYNKLRYGVLGSLVHLPGGPGRGISLSIYKISRKVVGFS